MQERPTFNMEIVGENLRKIRKAKNLSVKEVTEYLGFSSVQAIYKYESGTGYPQVESMFALMCLYEASIEDLINKHTDDEIIEKFSKEGYRPSFFARLCKDGYKNGICNVKMDTKTG
ncbi:Helix-turn-helix domain-containing protein [Pseudobutyrivibrio sp. ACV-2]|uniref:Helix-turn-helix transcriptional regulator n=1 Tax=Pseudobutyrivibrio xylanivorans TaxID=185007 RepID=A0A5P6VM46_PSEXY|nr:MULTISPECIES: helix-turn-helix transcriptional regulator [Pseudobutyrivibrio]QFJ53405.1 helix-turn-helix transcriptional regulator [Pseudobutyrivibrio xylanivorans]QFJ53482.1 helix-turn-helix transcriptional regulator [Pseudobutyrivibrio xylanivorans]SEB04581.1 Helix-turn-helix domain-containing protein [Pseudobutyrivibrio sp. ACV-2]